MHLFANPLEDNPPNPEDDNVFVVKPGIHRLEHLLDPLTSPASPHGKAPDVLYFAPGMHYIEETILPIPSGKTVYIAGGAAVAGSMVCDSVENVTVRGRGMLYLADFHRFSAFRGVRIRFSKQIAVEGVILLDPPHYSIYIGGSEHVNIRNFKSFSTKGWSDGIDIMSSSHIDIDAVFLRTSDDCIAVYGSRWQYYGDSKDITVRNSVFWADVAHALNVGIHGDHHRNGDVIENIRFENIDILEHHEPQPNYWGAMAICAGDKNIVRNVTFDNIRVEHIELGQLFDIRVVWNKDYNPVAGKRVENILFKNIVYNGDNPNPSRIYGFDGERAVEGVTFVNLRINGQTVMQADHPALDVNEFARNIVFRAE
ncbi:glycosyl hydrolase family 28 protein [Paenibacillus alkalitolerans]|uniref:glycosyl hydrolase family 28 protein n=1 Tax=Paenibacillus alkalitolerans TaxID=2799335 RepID=UPI001F1BEC50|nr:glycosyl hydrolase family 28 protein [Paenibacillus alkalitolerans]